MKRNELVKLASKNGIAKASSTKSTVLIEKLNELGVDTSTKKKGRPVDPTSKRQIRLAELAEKKANGTLKKGRPIVEGSKRQQRIAELASKAEANGGVVKRGRNIDPTSKRQIRLAELEAKRAAGTLKRGRPSTKVEGLEIELNDKGNIDVVAV